MENNQIAGLLLSGSAIFAAIGAVHMSIRARRALGPAAPAPQLIDIDVLMARDDSGWWTNPGVPDVGEDVTAWKEWIEAQQLEIDYAMLEDEDPDHPAYVAYYDKGENSVAAWDARSPRRQREGWHTLSIHDSEDGPVWVFARRARLEGKAP
ncbi:MAG: hypothetical protein K0R43_1683 [Pseudoduganella sp.]|nr:hypothetical protein [Pseudoduganella sp.]